MLAVIFDDKRILLKFQSFQTRLNFNNFIVFYCFESRLQAALTTFTVCVNEELKPPEGGTRNLAQEEFYGS